MTAPEESVDVSALYTLPSSFTVPRVETAGAAEELPIATFPSAAEAPLPKAMLSVPLLWALKPRETEFCPDAFAVAPKATPLVIADVSRPMANESMMV